MLTNPAEEITFEEAVRLFQIMKKHGVPCGVDMYVREMPDLLFTVWESSVDVEIHYPPDDPALIFFRMEGANIRLGIDKYRFYKDIIHFQNCYQLRLTASRVGAKVGFYNINCIPTIAWEEMQIEQEEAVV